VLTRRLVSQKIVPYMTKRSRDDLLFLTELIEAGKVKPVLDRTYSLAETAEAIEYLEQGHARGKVVVTV
jgi:NADPH:quinone reductase-like Zn-dependent oxidoreductase